MDFYKLDNKLFFKAGKKETTGIYELENIFDHYEKKFLCDDELEDKVISTTPNTIREILENNKETHKLLQETFVSNVAYVSVAFEYSPLMTNIAEILCKTENQILFLKQPDLKIFLAIDFIKKYFTVSTISNIGNIILPEMVVLTLETAIEANKKYDAYLSLFSIVEATLPENETIDYKHYIRDFAKNSKIKFGILQKIMQNPQVAHYLKDYL